MSSKFDRYDQTSVQISVSMRGSSVRSSSVEWNVTAIGAGAIVDASNKICFGNSQVTVIEGQVPYTFVSDRNQKENFHAVDGEAVLKKVGGLHLTSWNYIGHNPQQFRHYGPVAQEFLYRIRTGCGRA